MNSSDEPEFPENIKMKSLSKFTTVALLAITAVILVRNARYLYTTPIANTWIWWPGDETWLMSQYSHFVRTGHYNNPLAFGSVFSRCSGLLFGSCYLTAAIYELPLLIIKGHTIDTGRTVTWVFSLLTLLALWMIARRYRVAPVLRAFGCLLLSATVCFFITSHSARADMLTGLTILLFAGCLPLVIEKHYVNKDLLLGFLFPLSLLVNGHVLIVSFPMLGYIIWSSSIIRSKRSILRCAGAAVIGFSCLFIAQVAMLGSPSLLGPFINASNTMPILRLFHPKAQLGNYNWRIFIVNLWAPGLLWVSVVLAASLLWARFRYKVRLSSMEPVGRRLIVSATLVVLTSIFLEYYEPRYFIFVLPTIVLSFLFVISHLARRGPRASVTAIAVAMSACLAFGLCRYAFDTAKLGVAGETITAANKKAVTEALAMIHSRHAGKVRIFSTIPGQSIAMDDSCELVTPIIYVQPSGFAASRSVLWKNAKIDYAIVCNPAQGNDVGETDSTIEWSARSNARIIFERAGPFSDIDRAYDPSNLNLLDTLRVYEFK